MDRVALFLVFLITMVTVHSCDATTGKIVRKCDQVKLDEDTKCADSGVDESMDDRPLDVCKCPDDKDCIATVPETLIFNKGEKKASNPFTYSCEAKPKGHYDVGVLLKGEIESGTTTKKGEKELKLGGENDAE